MPPAPALLLVAASFLLLYVVVHIRSNLHPVTLVTTADPKIDLDTTTGDSPATDTTEAKQAPTERVVILPEGALVPAGSHVRFNFETNQRELILDDHNPSHQHSPATPESYDRVKPKDGASTGSKKEFPPSNKWKQRYNKTHVDELLEQLGKEQSNGNTKAVMTLLDELEEEAHDINTGAGIMHSTHLSQLTRLLDPGNGSDVIKTAALTALQATLHNNRVALAKAKETGLMSALMGVLRWEAAKWMSDKTIIRKAVFILHSMLSNPSMEAESGEKKQKSFKVQFNEADGDAELRRAFDKCDDLTKKKIIDVLAVIGADTAVLRKRLVGENVRNWL